MPTSVTHRSKRREKKQGDTPLVRRNSDGPACQRTDAGLPVVAASHLRRSLSERHFRELRPTCDRCNADEARSIWEPRRLKPWRSPRESRQGHDRPRWDTGHWKARGESDRTTGLSASPRFTAPGAVCTEQSSLVRRNDPVPRNLISGGSGDAINLGHGANGPVSHDFVLWKNAKRPSLSVPREARAEFNLPRAPTLDPLAYSSREGSAYSGASTTDSTPTAKEENNINGRKGIERVTDISLGDLCEANHSLSGSREATLCCQHSPSSYSVVEGSQACDLDLRLRPYHRSGSSGGGRTEIPTTSVEDDDFYPHHSSSGSSSFSAACMLQVLTPTRSAYLSSCGSDSDAHGHPRTPRRDATQGRGWAAGVRKSPRRSPRGRKMSGRPCILAPVHACGAGTPNGRFPGLKASPPNISGARGAAAKAGKEGRRTMNADRVARDDVPAAAGGRSSGDSDDCRLRRRDPPGLSVSLHPLQPGKLHVGGAKDDQVSSVVCSTESRYTSMILTGRAFLRILFSGCLYICSEGY